MERIYQKIGRIREYHALVSSLEDNCLERLNADPIYRGALLHYLYLLADSCVSLAELVIKHRKLRLPQSYHEAFDILGEQGLLDSSFAYDFARIAGSRTFLAHDYERTDPRFICEQILSKLDDVHSFLEQIERALGALPSTAS